MRPLIAKPSLERPLEFFVKIGRKIPLKNGGFWAKNWSTPFLLLILHCQRKGKAVVARDRLSRFRDSLIREIISCIKDPYQLYKIN